MYLRQHAIGTSRLAAIEIGQLDPRQPFVATIFTEMTRVVLATTVSRASMTFEHTQRIHIFNLTRIGRSALIYSLNLIPGGLDSLAH